MDDDHDLGLGLHGGPCTSHQGPTWTLAGKQSVQVCHHPKCWPLPSPILGPAPTLIFSVFPCVDPGSPHPPPSQIPGTLQYRKSILKHLHLTGRILLPSACFAEAWLVPKNTASQFLRLQGWEKGFAFSFPDNGISKLFLLYSRMRTLELSFRLRPSDCMTISTSLVIHWPSNHQPTPVHAFSPFFSPHRNHTDNAPTILPSGMFVYTGL